MNGLEALKKLPKWLDDEHRDSEEEYFKASEEYKAIEKELKKLGKLEDIEDELGIDLITLFKAVYGGFYYKDKDCGCVFFNNNFDIHMGLGIVPFFSFTLINDNSYYYYFFKDYGKTWALTKEELEKC